MMDVLRKPLTVEYLPSKEALVQKHCRFCHHLMEIKQINLTEAVRQCYKCATPLKDLDLSDIEFFHRSYKDINKNPKDWISNVASEEDELRSLQSWMEQVSLTVSKYEDSDDDHNEDLKLGKKVIQKDPVCHLDDTGLEDLVNELQQSANFTNTESEWNNSAIHELDVALAKASSEKADTASLPFSFEDFFLPENPTPQFSSVPLNENLIVEENISSLLKENILHDASLVVTHDTSKQSKFDNGQETDRNSTLKFSEDCSTNNDIAAVSTVSENNSNIIEELTVSKNSLVNFKATLPITTEGLECAIRSPIDENVTSEKLIDAPGKTTAETITDLSIYEGSFHGMNYVKSPQNNGETSERLEMNMALDKNKCDSQLRAGKYNEETNRNLQENNIVAEKKSVSNGTSENDTDVNTLRDGGFKCQTVSNENADSVTNTLENDVDLSINNVSENGLKGNQTSLNNNQVLESSTCIDSAFFTATPEVDSKVKNHQGVSTIELSPESSIIITVDDPSIVLPNILTLNNSCILATGDTLKPPFFCDCDDKTLELPPSTQEKGGDHCVDLTLPALSVSSLMEQEGFDDVEHNVCFDLSDVEKVIFSPVKLKMDTLESMKKCKNQIKTTKLMLDTPKQNVCDPSVLASETNISNSIFLTVPADDDITPEMLQSADVGDVPVVFDCLYGDILQNLENDVHVEDSLEGFDNESVLPVAIDEESATVVHFDKRKNQVPDHTIEVDMAQTQVVNVNNLPGIVFHCDEDNEETSTGPTEVDVSPNVKVDVADESRTIVHCDNNKQTAIANPVEMASEDQVVDSNSTEQFAFSYSFCDGGEAFRIDVCGLNNGVSAEKSNVSTQLTVDEGFEKPFQSEATDVQYLNKLSAPVLSGQHFIGSEFHCKESISGICAGQTEISNDQIGPLKSVPRTSTPVNKYTSAEDKDSILRPVKPRLLSKGVEEDDELKSFAGAKFSLQAKKKKGANIGPDPKLVNRKQFVKRN